MLPTTLNRSYYPALDGLRGIAIVLVICCHNFNFIPYFRLGWVGVDLFFVLSGFLITDILLRTKGEKNFLQNFYLRRVLRIFPLYYGCVLLFFMIAPLFAQLAQQYHYYQQHQSMSWLHLQNWLYIFHEKPSDYLLLNHFWSLSVEEQFYLVWPFVVLAVRSTRRLGQIAMGVLLCCIAGRLASWMIIGNGYINFYFQYMTRVDGLCVGSLIAIWRFTEAGVARKKLLRTASILLGTHLVVAILAKTIFKGFPHFQFFGYSSVAILFGIAIYFSIEIRTKWSRFFLENAVLRYLGRISYGIYVYHWPVLILAKLYFLKPMIGRGYSPDSSYLILSVAALALTLLLSVLSYHFFEKRILSLKHVITGEDFFERIKKKISWLFSPRPRGSV
ncbi:MAG: acyltransferase [Chitinophagaceae bacterium]|nr:acyltransferase [Chitinophagaceae bacterium]